MSRSASFPREEIRTSSPSSSTMAVQGRAPWGRRLAVDKPWQAGPGQRLPSRPHAGGGGPEPKTWGLPSQMGILPQPQDTEAQSRGDRRRSGRAPATHTLPGHLAGCGPCPADNLTPHDRRGLGLTVKLRLADTDDDDGHRELGSLGKATKGQGKKREVRAGHSSGHSALMASAGP